MKIYVYVEDGKDSAREAQASVTINKGNGGMPTILTASEVKVVSKEDLQAVLAAKPKEAAVVPPTNQKAPQPTEAA